MSRARELAKVGGKNQQIIAGLSSHVGVSTFLNNVHMFSNLDVDGNVTVTGTTTFNGGTLTLGDANTDNIVFGGEVDSNIIPDDDGAYDLGSSTKEWKDLFIDGTAHIDTLDVDGNAGVIGNLTVTGTTTLNTALANSNLANSTVSYGGISLALGASDATPAFDLQDATGYPTSSLVGTITNAQLAGSIANAKLSNSTVSYGGISLALGGTDATPAFNLTDATGYPTSSLVGTITNAQLAGSIASGKLASTGVSAGTVGSSTAIPIITVNAQGQITNTSTTAIDSTTIENGSASVAVASNGPITSTGNHDFTAGIDVTGAGNFANNVAVSGNFDVDGATTLDGLTVAENATFSAAIDVDGHTNLDNVSVSGILTSTTELSSPLISGYNLLEAPHGNTTTITVKVDSKVSGEHRYHGSGSSLGYILDGVQSPLLTLTPGRTYRFDTSNGSNSGHPFRFYLDVDKSHAYTTGVTVNGTAGNSGSYTEITISDTTPDVLHYQCSAHGKMGNAVTTNSNAVHTPHAATFEGAVTGKGNVSIEGYLQLDGEFRDGDGNFGSSGQVLSSDGTDTAWVNAGSLSAGAAALVGVNAATANASHFVTMVDTASGNENIRVDTDLVYNPTTNTLTATNLSSSGATIDNVQLGVTNANEIDTSSGNLVIDSAGGTVTVDDNLTVSGNLTVNGTTTTINSTTVAIDDKNFQVATGAADDAAADGAGLTVDSGDGDKTFNFEATGDNWGASENLNLASGKVYKINNTSILSATALGSSVVSSSLTSVGTITSGVWQGTAIANSSLANSTVSYGGISLSLGGSDATPAFDLSDATNYPTSSLSGTITNAQLAGSIAASKLAGSIGNSKLSNSTVSYGGISLSLGGSDATPAFDLSDATNYPTSSLSGTITNAQLAGSIAASKLAGSIGDSKLSTISTANKVSISALNIDGGTDIGAALVNSDEIIVDDGGGGTNRRCDMSRVKTYIYGAMSGDATASSSGAVTLANSGVSAGTVGSSTAIPIITVDSKGRITNTSTTAVDSTTIENGSSSVAVAYNGAITSTGNHDFTAGIDVTGNITVTGTVDGRDVASDGSKLDGIESGATADQSAAEIRTLVGSASDSNVFTDALLSKLNGIESGATADQTSEEIQDIVGAMVSSNTESGITVTYQDADGTIDFAVASQTDNNFTNADHSKLDGIESGATADQTASEILTLIKTVDGSGSGLDADTLDGISSGSFLRSDTSDTFTGTLTVAGNIVPNSNGTRNLGSNGVRWANIYTSDLDLSNQAKGGNSIDGSWGSYLIEEGENDLFLKNRRTGKTYKFMLQEV